jgi:signal transduction histidine kinase
MPRRRRRIGLAGFLIVLTAGLRTDPAPALHGAGLVVLLALLSVVGGGAGLGLDRTGAPAHTLLAQGLLFALLIAGSATLVWIEPNEVGFIGGFASASVAASRVSRPVGMIVVGFTMVALAVAGIAGAPRPVTSILVSELGVVAFYQVGHYARRLRERTEQAEGLLIELEQTRAAQVRAATLAERQRLAREMHDVLAHSLSGLVVHLEGARLLALHEAVNPELTDTIERAHHLAQTGLGEARQAIGMLRDEDLPGPERLPALADEFERDSGIRCHVVVSGDPAELDSQTRLTLYRVTQEALTNIRKHAHPNRVELRLGYEPGGTRLTVETSGRSRDGRYATAAGTMTIGTMTAGTMTIGTMTAGTIAAGMITATG